MFRVGNKIVRVGNRIPKVENRTVLDFVSRGTSFPDKKLASTYFQFSNTGANKMFIDYQDGTGIHEYLPNSGDNFSYINETLYFYQDLVDVSKIGTIDANYPQERIVKIYFQYPEKVYNMLHQNFNMYKQFPQNLGNFKLQGFRFSGVNNLDGFPTKFRGGYFPSAVYLSGVSQNRLTKIPDWIGNSYIGQLTVSGVFDLSGGSVATEIDKISQTQGLYNLDISNNNITKNEDLPSTLKNMVLLRLLYINSSLFSTFPKRVGDSPYITNLLMTGCTNMANWGEGLGTMTNLSAIDFTVTQGTASPILPAVVTTDLPPGLGSCINLKTVTASRTYRLQNEIDTYVNNWYSFIVANASTSAGNTKFRNMTINVGDSLNNIHSTRPSGGATPTAVVTPPTTPIQKVYNLCKLYGHTWKIRNNENTATEIIAP